MIESKVEKYNQLIAQAYNELGIQNPVLRVQLININQISPNGYNPNKVAEKELRLLLESITQDGYTMPIVVIKSQVEGEDKYVIVDGFHRYFTMVNSKTIREKNHGFIPCSVISGEKADIIASTIRHNKARGKHNVMGDTNCIKQMLETKSQEEVCKALGMSADDLQKYIVFTSPELLLRDFDYSSGYKSFFEVVSEIKTQGGIKCLNKQK